VIRTLLDPAYAAHLYPWFKTASIINVVLCLMTEVEPTGKMLCVYQKKNNQDDFRSQMYVCPQQHTITTKLWTYRICCFHSTVTVCDLWTAPTVNVNEYLNCDKQKIE